MEVVFYTPHERQQIASSAGREVRPPAVLAPVGDCGQDDSLLKTQTQVVITILERDLVFWICSNYDSWMLKQTQKCL